MGSYHKLRRRLDHAGLRPSTRRGQNFLLDGNHLGFITDLARLSPSDVVLEVGPGTGFLTRQLAKRGCLVLAVELDHGLLPLAQEETASFPNVIYMQGDILAGKNKINPDVLTRLAEMLETKRGLLASDPKAVHAEPALKCVSNLPYSAGTPLILNLLASPLPWKTGVFLIQKEVGERIVAVPGGKNYGALSIAATLAAKTSIERIVGPKAFWPRPKVDSAVLRMDFLPAGERTALPWKNLRRVTNAVFGSRRKILKNALKGLLPEERIPAILADLALDPECRGETMGPEQFLALAVQVGKLEAQDG